MAQAEVLRPKRVYETIYVLRPDVDKSTSESISERLRDVIARERGVLTKVENWGRRKLAYPVQKHVRGVYVFFEYLGGGGLVAEVERNLRMLDTVLKFQTVKTSNEADETRQIAAEDVKFEHLEPPSDEVDETLAQRLGLEPRAGFLRSEPEIDDTDDVGMDDDDDREGGGDNT